MAEAKKLEVQEFKKYISSEFGGFSDSYIPRSLVWILRQKIPEGLPVGTLGSLAVRRRVDDKWLTKGFLIKNLSNQNSKIDIGGWSFSSYKPSSVFEGTNFGIFFHESLLKVEKTKMVKCLHALACELDWLKGDPFGLHKQE